MEKLVENECEPMRMEYLMLVCPKCGATEWRPEIKPSSTKDGANEVKLICNACGHVAFNTET